jgi:uncharacterized RDD family membrane protein YckC
VTDFLTSEQLVTGEAVALELPPASIGLRVVSGLIDVAIQVGALLLCLVATGFLASDSALAGVGSVLSIVLVLVIGPAVLETLTLGRTVGKLVMGTRTVRDDAGPISFHHAFVRHLLAVVEVWGLSGAPALVTALVNRKGKRLGDLLAGTYVVRDRVPLQLPAPPVMPPHLAGWAASADIAPLPDGLALALRQFLGRAPGLSPAARVQLGTELVGQVAHHVSPAPPPGSHPEHVLAAVAAERRQRDERRLWEQATRRQRLTGRSG